ncbi:MAG: hypothetical protein IKU93_01750 [Alistipes sp.]|nr:hypothetical protein [Alistipes sp.]
MKRFYLILSLVAMLFISCEGGLGEGGNTNFGNITLDENATELLEQTVNSDALTASGITFTASEAWSATVQEVRSECVWLTISPDHGEAGTYTLSIELEANETGASRSAEIVISCGGSTLKIKITQKAAEQITPPAPTIEDKNRIAALFFDDGKERVFFTYNDKGQIASIKYEEIEKNKLYEEITQTIKYDGRNITIPEVCYHLDTRNYPQTHSFRYKEEYTDGSAVLNSDGTLSSYIYDDEKFYISYGADGRVDKYTNEKSEAVALFTWEDGNLTSIYTDELGANLTISYSDKDNICGGVDWLWLLINGYGDSTGPMPLAVLNKNGGLQTKKLPQTLSIAGMSINLTYTFDAQGRIETVSLDGETLAFGYADETFTQYGWAPYVTKQEIVNYYNELISDNLGYNRHCVVRTHIGKDNYFDQTYTQQYHLNIESQMFVAPEYKYSSFEMESESDYTNAGYLHYYTEPYTNDFGQKAYYVYYYFSTFTLRHSYTLELWSDVQFSLYDAVTSQFIPASYPNEEWVPYFKLVETGREKMGASEGTDENGIKGVTQWYSIRFDKYATLAERNADPTKLNYTKYDTGFIDMTLWIPNEQ